MWRPFFYVIAAFTIREETMQQRRDLSVIAKVAKTATIIYGVLNIAYAAVLLWYNGVYSDFIDGTAETEDTLLFADSILINSGYVFLAAFIVVFIINGRWIYLASANAAIAAPSPDRITPGWAVGWYFVPIMNLFKPLTAMIEIWTASVGVVKHTGKEVPGWISLWWASWIILSIADSAASNMGTSPLSTPEDYINGNIVTSIIAVLWLIPIYLFWRIITEVSNAQQNPSEVFA